jgi:hypothetical protein
MEHLEAIVGQSDVTCAGAAVAAGSGVVRMKRVAPDRVMRDVIDGRTSC